MSEGHRGLEQSIMARIGARARTLGEDPNVLLARFGVERFLYRLSRSKHATRFVIKGAALMPLWLGDDARPTRDADLAGFGDLSNESLRSTFAEICDVAVEPDGIRFDPKSVRIAPIRKADQYGGRRVNLVGKLGRSRIPVQIDIGAAESIAPPPTRITLPPVLDLPAPTMRAYRPETSIAEKFHAIVHLGIANSRMKDFYDIDRLSLALAFDAATLRTAIATTFTRRATELPGAVPVGLSGEFANDAQKQKQWAAFVRRIDRLEKPNLADVVNRVRDFVMPPLMTDAAGAWPPGGPWKLSKESHRERRRTKGGVRE